MPTLSIQLYSLRNSGTLPEQLDIAKEAGFANVEALNSMLENAAEARALLDERGLVASCAHVSLPNARERFDAFVDAAKTLGCSALVVPALPGEFRPTDAEGWRAVGAELGGMAERMADEGLTFGFHNHHWEVAPLPGGALPLDLLLDAGAPGGLKWQADIAWLVRGDDDVLARIDRHGDRLHSVHVKDIAPEGEAADEDGWADVGHGRLDWDEYWALTSPHARLMIAEHDKPSDGARFARRSLETMRRLDGGRA